jgi:hypothetical protein
LWQDDWLEPSRGAHISGMTRDHWIENLACPDCKRTGVAQLSDADEHSLKIQVDGVPEGFKVVHLKHGVNFYCSSCDCPAEL